MRLAERLIATAVVVMLVGGAEPAGGPQAPGLSSSPARTATDWAALIDATWGPGAPAEEQLALFDQVLDDIEAGYGAFHNIDLDLNRIREDYRSEIAGGVSRGRFAAVMNHVSLRLMDCHSYIIDRQVNWGTAVQPGIPLLVVSAWPDTNRFGATLTVLPDDTLLVIRVLPGQQLGLEPGDIVLGYDGTPWSRLYRDLLEAELPIQLNWSCGSTPESMHHCMMMSAGLNWHLFDTIDVVKYRTGETIHLPTAPLVNQRGTIYGNEQLPIPGVPMPDYSAGDFVSWGLVDETDIGYIYVASWDTRPEYQISEQFAEAVHALMFDYDTEGLIVDFRMNTGGGATTPNDGFALLFDNEISTVGFADRVTGSVDPYAMFPDPIRTPELMKIRGDPSTYYDRPIAVLTGPGTVSAGDVHALRLRFHPNARIFGKPTNGGFTFNDNPDLGPRWWASKAIGCAYLVDDGAFLAHTGVPVDFAVWLRQEDVAAGRDTVVEAAIAWIRQPAPRRPSGRRTPDLSGPVKGSSD